MHERELEIHLVLRRIKMAQFSKVNPVIDGNAASFFGKVPDYVEINFGATSNITSAQNVAQGGAWPLVIQTIEQYSTIEVLGALQANCALISQNGGNANVGVRLLVTGVNSEFGSASNIAAAIQALGVVVVGNATVGYSNVNLAPTTVAVSTIGNVVGVPGTSTFYF